MSEEFELTGELAELENQLRDLPPAESRLDHDTLLFRAGWEAALAQSPSGKKRRPNLSQLLAATFAAISAVLAMLLMQPLDTASPTYQRDARPVASKSERMPQTPDTAKAPSPVPIEAPQQGVTDIWTKRRNRPLLRGRRDPERWLRATDRMTVGNNADVSYGTPGTLRDLYQSLRSEILLRERQPQPTGEQQL